MDETRNLRQIGEALSRLADSCTTDQDSTARVLRQLRNELHEQIVTLCLTARPQALTPSMDPLPTRTVEKLDAAVGERVVVDADDPAQRFFVPVRKVVAR